MKFQPIKDRVLISYDEEMDKTPGGLYIPDNAKQKPQRGTVVAVGGKVRTFSKGDSVLFDRYSGTKLTVESVEYLLIKEDDVLGFFIEDKQV